jgi:CheY-like chemotaxis protein
MEEKTQEMLMAQARQGVEDSGQVELLEARKQALMPSFASHSPIQGVSVLLVDDNNINLTLLATFMKKQRHAYDTATNGVEALQVYQAQIDPTRLPGQSANSLLLQNRSELTAQSFDFVLMDINMPKMDVSIVTYNYDHIFEHGANYYSRVSNPLAAFELSSEPRDSVPQSLSRSLAWHLQVYNKKLSPAELISS